ncbi:Uncharacterised protein [Vibrio cholerae]|nr:Uncharacterised protein [Vibrio cholerae]CSB49843.1 Uncharacterised protein [Vibrio cholerae]CSC53618.1 Uncharacterised protein [Vibrio cholerae]CSC92285.1 Uncharacterised protein [Vibrio cholerae]
MSIDINYIQIHQSPQRVLAFNLHHGFFQHAGRWSLNYHKGFRSGFFHQQLTSHLPPARFLTELLNGTHTCIHHGLAGSVELNRARHVNRERNQRQ